MPSLIIVTTAIYPRLVLNYDFIYTSRPTKLRISKQSLEHFRGSLEFPNQRLRHN